MTEPADAITTAYTGMLPFALIVTAIATPFLAYLLLRLYRRAVLRSMNRCSKAAMQAVPVPSVDETPGTREKPPLVFDFAAAAALPGIGAPPVSWRVSAVYVVAGAAFALVMTLATLLSARLEFYPIRLALVFLVYLWPIFLILYLDGSARRRTILMIFASYLGGMLALSALALARSPDLTLTQLATLWLIMNAPAAVITLAFAARPVRAVGPLVVLFLLVVITGSVAGLSLLGSGDRTLDFFAAAGSALGLNAVSTLGGMALIALLPFALLGWFILARIRGAYVAKRINDKSITMDAVYLLFGTVHSIGLAFEGLPWILAGPVAFAAYQATLRLGLKLRFVNASSNEPGSTLLLLRVFALGKRSQQLFDALTRGWRYQGPIALIAGPDLATTTIDPEEFLEFVSGGLDKLFIGDEKSLSLALAELDKKPDFDRRYRVNDFFCHDNTWKMVLSSLVQNSDVVLMDLRDFTPDNAGCIYELTELVNLMPLSRVILVVDNTTDRSFLEQALTNAWQDVRAPSPNATLARPEIRMISFDGFGEYQLRGLMAALHAVASRLSD